MFALVFWQLVELENRLSAEELLAHGMTLDFESENDEVFAVFMGTFMELWNSSKSFDATSRFVADALEMSANELIQGKVLLAQTPAP